MNLQDAILAMQQKIFLYSFVLINQNNHNQRRKFNMSYKAQENLMRSVISSLKPGEKFCLKDVVSGAPPQLGTTLFKEVRNGDIPNVKYVGKINGVEQYEKL